MRYWTMRTKFLLASAALLLAIAADHEVLAWREQPEG